MQLLTKGSEEGKLAGLGLVDAEVKKFKLENMRVPHMGWNFVQSKKESKLTTDLPEKSRFYFVHSYHPVLTNGEDALVTADYGYSFVAGMEHENILGVQFHPEKSHKFGMKLLENFVKYY